MGPRARLEGVEKTKNLLSIPGFEPRTVQPVAWWNNLLWSSTAQYKLHLEERTLLRL